MCLDGSVFATELVNTELHNMSDTGPEFPQLPFLRVQETMNYQGMCNEDEPIGVSVGCDEIADTEDIHEDTDASRSCGETDQPETKQETREAEIAQALSKPCRKKKVAPKNPHLGKIPKCLIDDLLKRFRASFPTGIAMSSLDILTNKAFETIVFDPKCHLLAKMCAHLNTTDIKSVGDLKGMNLTNEQATRVLDVAMGSRSVRTCSLTKFPCPKCDATAIHSFRKLTGGVRSTYYFRGSDKKVAFQARCTALGISGAHKKRKRKSRKGLKANKPKKKAKGETNATTGGHWGILTSNLMDIAMTCVSKNNERRQLIELKQCMDNENKKSSGFLLEDVP
jgi:hypothetical protein